MLYQFGVLQFATFPLSILDTSHDREADFAWKDVVGTLRPAEKVGKGSDEFTVRCALYPHRFGGLGELALLEAMQDAQDEHILVRGDGTSLGWRVVTRMQARSTYLDVEGVGRCVEVTMTLKLAPPPSRGAMLSFFSTLIGQIRSILG